MYIAFIFLGLWLLTPVTILRLSMTVPQLLREELSQRHPLVV
jgi:hypothetical protein